jgi:tRNA dimethylallyltransferase
MTIPPTYPQLLLIGGPTSSGKSALALALAQRLNGAVINADALQLYREIPILSGQPSLAERALVPHYLYGARGVAESASAAWWQEAAKDAIAKTQAVGHLPIVVGGTGLYLSTLLDGISAMPEVAADTRQRVKDLLDQSGVGAVHAALAAIDPVAAGELKPRDQQRLCRALEVVWQTGRSIRDWQGQKQGAWPGAIKTIAILPPKADVYKKCQARFDTMMDMGALDEVRAIESAGLGDHLTALKAKGIPELRAHLRGELSLAEAVRLAKLKTRQYAKRQFTWFTQQWQPDYVIGEMVTADNTSLLADGIGQGLT